VSPQGLSDSVIDRMVEHEVTLPGGVFRYLGASPPARADAPLVVLLHGFPDHPPSFVPVMARLVEAGYRVAAPWMRGYHPSVRRGPYDIGRLAQDIIELVRTLAPHGPSFAVGHDWGAVALYHALALAPAQFVAATTLAVPHPQAFFDRLWRSPAQLRRSWYMFFFQLPGVAEHLLSRRDFSFIDRLWRAWSPDYRLPDADRAALHACLRASMPAPLAHYRALLWPPRQAMRVLRGGVLARPVSVPVLYLHGARDGCIGSAMGDGQDALFTGLYERAIIPRAGHFLHLEAPDMVASFIVDWFQEFPGHA
jgi:pimeloyl-ACP methyl ester carboxylesterase